jgi:uncharacterized protein GlcG (DUF336 family)
LGFGSREIANRAAKIPIFSLHSLPSARDGWVPVPGGVLVLDRYAGVIGAVGISGDTSDSDEICAVAGIGAAGLVAQVGAALDEKQASIGRLAKAAKVLC